MKVRELIEELQGLNGEATVAMIAGEYPANIGTVSFYASLETDNEDQGAYWPYSAYQDWDEVLNVNEHGYAVIRGW